MCVCASPGLCVALRCVCVCVRFTWDLCCSEVSVCVCASPGLCAALR